MLNAVQIVMMLLAPVQAPAEKVKVEFRWLAAAPVKGVTEEKGIQTTCGPDLLYPHLTPVITNAQVAATVLTQHDLSKNGLGKELYMIKFLLTEDAIKTLKKGAGDQRLMVLGIFVDGKYQSAAGYRKDDTAEFSPSLGLLSSKTEAEAIVEACKKP